MDQWHNNERTQKDEDKEEEEEDRVEDFSCFFTGKVQYFIFEQVKRKERGEGRKEREKVARKQKKAKEKIGKETIFKFNDANQTV